MKTSAVRSVDSDGKEKMVFRVHDVPSIHDNFFEAEFFSRQGSDFIRDFPADIPGASEAAGNFRTHGMEMFRPVMSGEPVDWRAGLLAFIERMEGLGQGIPWFLTGSCALTVRGIDVQPSDVDFVFPRFSDMERVGQIFRKETVYPFCDCGDWVTRGYGAAWMHAILAMAFEPLACLDDPFPIDSGPAAIENLEKVSWMGREISVPPLEYCLNINRRRERTERVELLEKIIGKG
ncbi:MAG: hypothetical protein CVV64_18785 [Candidatus Wallbacteria bacterium HGW-Wallbacteria-1]|jgi:hypothetical protein|uniref:Nucleotidyltransferase n=1 Tax=Candidatus Wallbacteria bacterium HGW-Wallbacteria-1 TaxID=2013854 RepID=A0A2N1PJF3_9BACT|nr:MAG: hypothetical protein CVV64_18785 [Candidatus Wallbacteria bacterium HGW-Wallbacteria-1]